MQNIRREMRTTRQSVGQISLGVSTKVNPCPLSETGYFSAAHCTVTSSLPSVLPSNTSPVRRPNVHRSEKMCFSGTGILISSRVSRFGAHLPKVIVSRRRVDSVLQLYARRITTHLSRRRISQFTETRHPNTDATGVSCYHHRFHRRMIAPAQ